MEISITFETKILSENGGFFISALQISSQNHQSVD